MNTQTHPDALADMAATLSQTAASLSQIVASLAQLTARMYDDARGPAIPFDDPKPVAAKPVAAKPVAAKPVAAKPVAAKPVAAKPVAAKPVAARAAVDTGPDEHSERDVRNALLAVQAATSRDTAMAILAEVCGADVRTAASVAVDDYARLIDRCNEVAVGGAE